MAKMQKSKMKKIVKEKKIAKAKPKSFLELKQQQKASRIKKARAQVMKEKKLEKEQKESKKSIADVAKEQEKLVVEKQKKLGMAEELRNLYPELNDSEFNSLLKTQFGIQLPTITGLQPTSMITQAEEGSKKIGRRTKGQIAEFNQKIRDSTKEDLLNLLEKGEYSPAEQRQIKVQLKLVSLQEKRLEEEKRMKPIKEQEELKKKEQDAKIQERLDNERKKLEILQTREKEAKTTEEKRKLQKAKDDEKERIRLLEEQDKRTKKEIARVKEIKDKKQLEKDKIQLEKNKIQLEKDYATQEKKLQDERESLATEYFNLQKNHKKVKARTEEEQAKQDEKYRRRQDRIDRVTEKANNIEEKLANLQLLKEQGIREFDMRLQDLQGDREYIGLGEQVDDAEFQQGMQALEQPPQEIVIQDPEQNIAQAEMDAEVPEQANIPVEGLGLAKKYALHPSHIMERKDKYELSKKGKKHFDNLKLFLTKKQIDYILHYSLLNKARNDKLGLANKFNGKNTVKGYRKSSRGGNIVYTKI